MSINQNSLHFLKPTQIKTDSESLAYYGKDWTTYFDIKASAILFPETTNDVVQIVKWANSTNTALVPSGGRTGLSGGACATKNEVVVSFEKMNKFLDFNSTSQTVRVQPGVITEDLQKYAQTKNLFYPVDFAARGSSQIGGNIATNAGGIKVVRYGLTRDWVTSLEVVTGTGEILHLNNNLVKNATGLDLRHLFIGSEGILGFVTEATIKLAPAPAATKVLLLATPDLDKIMDVFSAFKTRSTLNAFEFFSNLAFRKSSSFNSVAKPILLNHRTIILLQRSNAEMMRMSKIF
jgi:FAD/FMN-containing dehydrogenase